MRILFVEDSEADKLLAEREIKKENIEIISERVETDKDFREQLTKFNPDVIISDYSMPSFDGMSALKILLSQGRNIPFIVLTGSINERIAVECMKAGADDYIIKENLNRLYPAIESSIKKHHNIREKIQKENELKIYREKLEELVDERTEELKSVNIKLKEQLEKGYELESKLKESLIREREINELKTKFISTVSHEFRTPLAALLSSSQLIQRYSKSYDNPKVTKHHNIIDSTIKYLTDLLDDILTINRMDRQVISNNPEPCRLSELIRSYSYELEQYLTDSHKMEVNIEGTEENILIDPKLLRRSVMNLLTNAVKYSPKGGLVSLSAKVENKRLMITVSDKGLGIPEEEIKYIFDPFYRTVNTIGIQGSGLGLNLVKEAVNLMGGEISVESKINIGSIFIIKIPIEINVKKK